MLLLAQLQLQTSTGVHSAWTLDGWSGWPTAWTLDGWPAPGIPWTLDGWVAPFGGGGGGGGGGSSTPGNLLGLLFPLNLDAIPPQPPGLQILVQAMQDGYYHGLFHPKGDQFYIFNVAEFSDAAQSIVPVGNPVYPVYGWMMKVVGAQEFDQAQSLQSWPRNYIKRTVI